MSVEMAQTVNVSSIFKEQGILGQDLALKLMDWAEKNSPSFREAHLEAAGKDGFSGVIFAITPGAPQAPIRMILSVGSEKVLFEFDPARQTCNGEAMSRQEMDIILAANGAARGSTFRDIRCPDSGFVPVNFPDLTLPPDDYFRQPGLSSICFAGVSLRVPPTDVSEVFKKSKEGAAAANKLVRQAAKESAAFAVAAKASDTAEGFPTGVKILFGGRDQELILEAGGVQHKFMVDMLCQVCTGKTNVPLNEGEFQAVMAAAASLPMTVFTLLPERMGRSCDLTWPDSFSFLSGAKP